MMAGEKLVTVEIRFVTGPTSPVPSPKPSAEPRRKPSTVETSV